MAEPEEILRSALTWAKDNSYTIDRRFAYGIYCDAIRALALQNNQKGLGNAEKLLGVSPEWIRAFCYGFGGNEPSRRGLDGAVMETPIEAFQLGQKLALEACGETSWTFQK